MKFALYQPWIYLHGGLERSILELVKRSRHQWVIYTGHYDAKGTFPEFRKLNVQVIGKTNVKRNFSGVLSSCLNTLLVKFPLDQSFDGLVVWCDGIGDLVTFRNDRLPVFNICSTPLRAAFDPVYQDMLTKGMKLRSRVLYRGFKTVFRAVDRLAWRKFRGVVTTSTEVKNRILAGGLSKPGKNMVMAYPGISWEPIHDSTSFTKMILVPGRIMWTKNIEQAIRAFLQARLPSPWKLVIAGYVDEKSKVYLAELMALANASPSVEFMPCPTDEALQKLYREASFCLFTPLNEDWGIVPLESMARGKTVIANARGGPLESIIDGETGILLEPRDDLWIGALQKLSADDKLVELLGRQAHEHVRKFTWEQFVTTVDQALEDWTEGRASPCPVETAATAKRMSSSSAPAAHRRLN